MFRIAYYHTAHAVFAVCSIRLVYVSYTERYTTDDVSHWCEDSVVFLFLESAATSQPT